MKLFNTLHFVFALSFAQAQCLFEIRPLDKGNGMELKWINSADCPSPTLDSIKFDDVSYAGADKGPDAWRTSASLTFDVSGAHTVTYKNSGSDLNCSYQDGALVGALPVVWGYFEAAKQNGRVTPKWSTLAELNNEYFAAERRNGSQFETIAILDGKGTESNISHYSFEDQQDVTGTLHYRIK